MTPAVVYLPVLMSGLLALAARPLARRLSPAAARALAMAAVALAASWYWMLVLLLLCLIDDLPHSPLLDQIPVPDAISWMAGVALVWCAWRLVDALTRRRGLRRGLAAVLGSGEGELVVVSDPVPHAFALAGGPGTAGRIVVSSAMLRALTAPQRRAMLAHERAHLAHGHAMVLMLAQLSAAVNPLLAPLREAVAFLCERHADELAATDVGDRYVVAEALAAAAMVSSPAAVPAPAFHRVGVVDRVAALVAPPRRYRPLGSFALATASAIALVALLSMCDATDQLSGLLWRIVAG